MSTILTQALFFSIGIFSVCSLSAEDAVEKLQIKLVQQKGCASCHGTKGQGNPYMKGPRLAGQTSRQLTTKLKAYRSGERQNPTMSVMSASLTDTDIESLAQYFSQFK